MEREILLVLGKSPDHSNLSDPGQFWPMFRRWCRDNDVNYRLHEHPDDMVDFAIFKNTMEISEVSRRVEQMENNGTKIAEEVGVEAWHAALAAMGKIKVEA